MATPAHGAARQRRGWGRGLLISAGSAVAFVAIGAVAVRFIATSPVQGGGGGTSPASHSDAPLGPPPIPSATTRPVASVGANLLVAGRPGRLPWPAGGEGAVVVQGAGLLAQSRHQPVVPIASVTKVMTAYILLEDHPLAALSTGPVLTMTAADALGYDHAVAYDESSVRVVKGERLNERQLLEALMIPSANNIADLLAEWDAGSVPAFVAKMNRTARALGLASTHYADPSGFDPGDRSTAVDQAKLASVAMTIPAFASIVKLSHVRLPVAGEVWGYNPALGRAGVVGVKSGFTSQALGCLTVAALRQIDGRPTLIITVVLRQVLGLYQAADEDIALVIAAARELVARPVATAGEVFAEFHVPWLSHAVPAVAEVPAALLSWPGLQYSVVVRAGLGTRPWRPIVERSRKHPAKVVGWTIPAGVDAGRIDVIAAGRPTLHIGLRLQSTIPGPPPGWSPATPPVAQG